MDVDVDEALAEQLAAAVDDLRVRHLDDVRSDGRDAAVPDQDVAPPPAVAVDERTTFQQNSRHSLHHI